MSMIQIYFSSILISVSPKFVLPPEIKHDSLFSLHKNLLFTSNGLTGENILMFFQSKCQLRWRIKPDKFDLKHTELSKCATYIDFIVGNYPKMTWSMTLAKIKGILFTNASVWERKYNYQNTQGKVQSSAPFSTLFDCKCCEKKVRLRFCLRPKT